MNTIAAEHQTPEVCALTSTAGLSDDEMAMLELEASWWKHNGLKETLVRERFDISPTIYYARLGRLIDRPEALAAAPLVVRRLQRLREQRRAQRSATRLASDS
jgi:hypothetical protein